MSERVEILGVKVDAVTMAQAVERVANLIAEKKSSIVATANAEMLLRATHDDELKNILNAANLVVPDGAGTVWAARHLGKHMPERVAGFDLVQELMKLAPVKSWKFFLFGSAPGIADKAKVKAEELYLGVPKQEKWLAKFRDELQIPVSIGVGGTFDVMAGVVKRAPLWMQRAKLEWLFRAMLQPSRAGRLVALPKFVLKVHQQKVRSRD